MRVDVYCPLIFVRPTQPERELDRLNFNPVKFLYFLTFLIAKQLRLFISRKFKKNTRISL